MKPATLQIDNLTIDRLILIPYTIRICNNILNGNMDELLQKGFKKGKSWPDNDVLETLPRIINNLSKVEAPTGFESWMIIKKDTLEIIGDAGFKGLNSEEGNIDIGYGIIQEERRNGYAEEAASALIQWAFTNEIVKEITASCSFHNTGSIKLLQKLNFTQIKREAEMIGWLLTKN